jgi:DNA-binding NarL/FixJ family response regulator
MMRIRVVLADDHPVLLDGIRRVVQSDSGIEIVATCTTGNEALDAVRCAHPDVLVVDLNMPCMDGLCVARQLQNEPQPVKIVLMAAVISDNEVLEAVRVGVTGILLKELAPKQLIPCIRKVAAGDAWLELSSTARLLETLVATRRAGDFTQFGHDAER